MREVVEMMFDEMASALGYDAWYETEELWDGMAEVMVSAGLDEKEVNSFFSDMAWEL